MYLEGIGIVNESEYANISILFNESDTAIQNSLGHSGSGNFKKSIAYLYITFGALMIIPNLAIIVDILRHRVLRMRKEYILLTGLTSADFLTGIGTLIAGAYRWDLISRGLDSNKINRWNCMGASHFILIIFAINVQAGMFIVMSLDRLIAVIKPLEHNIFTRRYSLIMVVTCYTIAFLYTAILFAYLFAIYGDSKDRISPLCFSVDVDKTFDSMFHGVRVCLASVSVILYLIVWHLYHKYNRATIAQFPTTANRLRRQQLHLTITVGICVLLTFGLYVIPATLLVLSKWTNSMGFWRHIFWVLNCVNAIVNVFVYSLRHKNIRDGLKLLLYCRELPSSAELRLKRESQCTMIDSVSSRRNTFIT